MLLVLALPAWYALPRTASSPTNAALLQDLPRVDADQLIQDLSVLAHDSMEGRRSGTSGNERARSFLASEFERRGFESLDRERIQTFTFSDGGALRIGGNVIGLIPGRQSPDRYIVVSAHYDHLGTRNGDIYNGADDNGSGVAALLTVGDFFVRYPPRRSLLLVAFDAEELGLLGAHAFVDDPPVPLDSILLNVNLDMVSRSDRRELYAAGTYHYPFLAPLLQEVADRAPVSLLSGHDSPELGPGDNWTDLSDHGPFHRAGVPFLYFGVEDHRDYHRPSDTLENVTADFYVAAVETIIDFLFVADRRLDSPA
jgi:Zn-dependent M28 family amino/carboxypeptidase